MNRSAHLALKKYTEELAVRKAEVDAKIQELKEKGPETGDQRSYLRDNYVRRERDASRHAHLALCYLKGRKYAEVEKGAACRPKIYHMQQILQDIGGERVNPQDLQDWVDPVNEFMKAYKALEHQMCREREIRESMSLPWGHMTPEQKDDVQKRVQASPDYRCERCQHKWAPKDTSEGRFPTVCPRCKSPYWNQSQEAGIPHLVRRRGTDLSPGHYEVSPVAYWYRGGYFESEEEALGAFKLAYQQGLDGMGQSVAGWMGLTDEEYDAWMRDNSLPKKGGGKK